MIGLWLPLLIGYLIVGSYWGLVWYVVGHGQDLGDKLIAVFLTLFWPVPIILIAWSEWKATK